MDILKVFIDEVKRQLDKIIKIVKTLQQNGAIEMRNHTLMDIVRSMLNYSIVLLSFWMLALNLLHISLTSFLGCSIEVKMYNSYENKSNARIINGVIIGYSKDKGETSNVIGIEIFRDI
ncbi:hypothetical protein CR513_63071, partial [Mucuna pruriens]